MHCFICNDNKKKYYNDATMVVLPSDHLIKDEDSFRNILLDGEKKY